MGSLYFKQLGSAGQGLGVQPRLLSNHLEMLSKLSGYPDPGKEKIWSGGKARINKSGDIRVC
jgi:hypothetical protein